MKIAVSGPARALSVREKSIIDQVLSWHVGGDDILVSGAAIGVDTEAALWAFSRDIPVILVRPIEKSHNAALSEVPDLLEDLIVYGSYMDRNDALAEIGEELCAFPERGVEELRSGTWSTIRRFRRYNKSVNLKPLGKEI